MQQTAEHLDRVIEELVRQVDTAAIYGDASFADFDDRSSSEPTAATWGGGGSSDDLEDIPF